MPSPLRGFEFLAWLESGFDAETNVMEGLADNVVSSTSKAEATTTEVAARDVEETVSCTGKNVEKEHKDDQINQDEDNTTGTHPVSLVF